ncbi:uncharacterized protein A1O5_02496 [Cladophialophora psammophila CBS 110553]|uniref:Clr5 domain-containing protein n=1 Tax=Cladophialophora psammophila CBS 110553 TaxID=1182543 RepID=W9X147_9EURO|nr:uncharacterized protein A1O5_02496 [Cladophialophora psammophila CBS 110553]EXJ74202.1 hypothetical protein A1O5_02496 [Cladophialophora psammophila CBS 110553]
MYKKRLRDWELWKNYTQLQKIDAIKQLTEARLETQGSLSLTLNGKPLKEHRLWRPVLQRRKRVILAPRPCPDSSKIQRKHLQELRRTPSPQRIQLQLGRETQTVESLLKYAQTYHSWCQSQDQDRAAYYHIVELHEGFSGLVAGLSLLVRDDPRAFQVINKSCFAFRAPFQSKPFRLMLEVVVTFGAYKPYWGEHWRVGKSVLKFFASLANTTLGMLHPITNFATLLLDIIEQQRFAPFSARYAELLMHGTETGYEDDTRAEIQLAIADFLLKVGQLDMGSSLCRRLWECLQPIPSSPTPLHRRLLQVMHIVFMEEEDYAAAERVIMQQLSCSVAATGKQNGDIYGVSACQRLAWLYSKTRLSEEIKKFCRLAVEGALEVFQSESGVLIILFKVERFLSILGKEEDIAQLRTECQHIRAALDEWRLDLGFEPE